MTDTAIITQGLPVPARRAGTADIIGFGQDGVVILRNSVRPQVSRVVVNFGYNAGGWRVDQHPRLVGDTTGNGNSDIIGFGGAGVWISTNRGNNTFVNPTLVVNDFGQSQGWTVDRHIRYVADLRNTGRVDIIGFGDAGILVAPNNGNGTFGSTRLALNDFGYNAGGWRLDRHLRFLADINGNGLPDIIGFGESAVFVSMNSGNGTFQPAKVIVNNFTISNGWQIGKHPRTVADLTGDGRADIIGFGEAGVYVSLNNGNGTFQAPQLVVKDFGFASGWRVENHPRFVVDITGDGRGDIVGFGESGLWVAINNGNGTFQAPKLILNDFGVASGWSVGKHLRFPVDLTGDGAADIIGFGDNKVYVSYNDGKGNFGPVQPLTEEFAFNGGQWGLDKTVRWVTNLFRD